MSTPRSMSSATTMRQFCTIASQEVSISEAFDGGAAGVGRDCSGTPR